MRRRLVLAVLCLVPALAWSQDQDQAQTPRPRLEDLFSVVGLGSLDFSPDGRRLLYTVRHAVLAKNAYDTDIWLLEFPERAAPRQVQLTSHSKDDTSPRWRPDGERLAFLSARDSGPGPGKPALYLMRPTGGEPEKLLQHQTAIRVFAWSPDGTRIAFTAEEPETAEEKTATEQGRDVAVEDQPEKYIHLWLLDVAGRRARRVTAGTDWSIQSFAWSPDGSTLAFAAAPSPRITEAWKSDLWIQSATDSAASPRRLTDNPGTDGSPVFSPDGAHLYFQGYQGAEYRIGQARVFRIPLAGGVPEDVTPEGDLDPSDYIFTPDGRAVFFEATTGTTRALFYMPLATRQPVRLSGTQGVTRQAAYAADRRRVAFVEESPSKPAEVYATALPNQLTPGVIKNVAPLTRHNAQATGWAPGLTDVLRWKSVDGREIEGLLVYPAGWSPARGRVPLVVKIHGGPSGVFVQNFQAASYNADAQRYAADGYAVLLPNPRGSSGYGDAGIRSVIEDWGGLDFQDIMAGVDAVIARGIAHPDSLGVMGWSYGGYMTAWTVSQTTRFKAAVAGAAITENIAMWGTQDIIHVFEGYFGGGPWEDGRWETYRASSPLAHLPGATTPTLVIHGRNDPRVPPNQALIFYRSLRALGVPTELVWLPRSGHGPSEPGLQYETARRQKEWMDRWIRKRVKPAVE
ncbi:MAG TPA: S9 family peptidase [Gemmatimonadales bacterium]